MRLNHHAAAVIAEDIPGIYPERKLWASSGAARCLMFYDWAKPVGPEWLGLALEIFREFGQAPFEGTCNLGEQHSHGRFGRVRKRFADFLEAISREGNPDFDLRLRSLPYVESDAFFPCDVEMVWSVDRAGRKKGWWLFGIR